MKRFTAFACLSVLLTTAPIFASSPKPQSVIIPQNVQVGAEKLPAGKYKVAWTGNGPEVQVTLTQRGKTVLTFAAKATETKNTLAGVDVDSTNGTTVLKGMILEGYSLQLEGAAAKPQSGQ